MEIKVNLEFLKSQLSELKIDYSKFSDAEIIKLHCDLQLSGVFDRYYSCTRKIKFGSLEQATLGSYQQEVFRRGLKHYVPYKCRYCWAYHVGRKPKK